MARSRDLRLLGLLEPSSCGKRRGHNPPRNVDFIYTCDDENRVNRNGHIRVKGRQAVDVGSEPSPDEDADSSFDPSGCLVIRGLINTHHHLFPVERSWHNRDAASLHHRQAGRTLYAVRQTRSCCHFLVQHRCVRRAVPFRSGANIQFDCSMNFGGTRTSGGGSREGSHLSLEGIIETISVWERAWTLC